jgi:hypothetical protein
VKFGLPAFTHRNLGLTLNQPELRGSDAALAAPWALEPGFAEAVPGSLGEFVAIPSRQVERPLLSVPEPGRLGKGEIPLDFGSGIRGDLLGEDLVSHYRASPGAFFLGQSYHPRAVRDYLGASSWLRSQARSSPLEWSEIGWTTPPRLERYQLARDQILLALSESGSYQESLLRLSRDKASREEYQDLFRAGLSAGDLRSHDPWSRGAGIAWDSVRGTVLGMRLFTEEQIGLLCPWNSREALRGSIREWATDGLVQRLPGPGLPMPVWKVTEAAAEDGFAAGLFDWEERKYRARYRGGQELHDLAVGDAILLLAMEVEAAGGRVSELRTELAMMAKRRSGSFADFELTYELAGTRREVAVEVVGLGNNYRTGAKAEKVRRSGFRTYVPGFDGRGVRLV